MCARHAKRSVPAPPEDPDLPEAQGLFHLEPASRRLAKFLAPRGWSLIDLRPTQALYRPGRSCTVRYLVQAVPRVGFPRYLALCARTRHSPATVLAPPEGFGVRFGLEDPVEERDGALVWSYPYDPSLAALPSAAHGRTVRDAAGVEGPVAVSVTPVAYRPGARAAFRYSVLAPGHRGETFYGKAVAEDAFGRIFDAYRSFERAGIRLSPPRAAAELPGLAFFPSIDGESLGTKLTKGEELPDPARLVGILETLANLPWRGHTEPDRPEVQIRSAGHLLAHILPDRRHEIRDAYRALAELVAAQRKDLTVHGDLYEEQMFFSRDMSVGLIDLEDAGPGDPLLDAANMLAHLTVMHYYTPEAEGRPAAYRVLLRESLIESLGGGDAELAWRESYCLLMLATGPFRVLRSDWKRETEDRVDSALAMLRQGKVGF